MTIYDPRLSNQWAADNFRKSMVSSITVITEERRSEGFTGKSIDPDYIRGCVLHNLLEAAYPAGVA